MPFSGLFLAAHFERTKEKDIDWFPSTRAWVGHGRCCHSSHPYHHTKKKEAFLLTLIHLNLDQKLYYRGGQPTLQHPFHTCMQPPNHTFALVHLFNFFSEWLESSASYSWVDTSDVSCLFYPFRCSCSGFRLKQGGAGVP